MPISLKIKIAEIHFKDKKVENYALEKVSRLEKFHSGIELLTVFLTTEKNHRTQNHTTFCELQFEIAGKNLIIKDSEREIEKAIDKAVERAKITLTKHKEKEISKKRRQAVKAKKLKRY